MHRRGRKVNQQRAIHDRARRTIPYTHKAHAIMSSAIRTANGQLFDYAQPRAHHLSLQVLAQGLSRESRFAGQSADLYTVAQHSVLASHLVPPHLARQALYHDASEALLKDLPKPLKVLLGGLPGHRASCRARDLQLAGTPRALGCRSQASRPDAFDCRTARPHAAAACGPQGRADSSTI